jgi:hypothetical protein
VKLKYFILFVSGVLTVGSFNSVVAGYEGGLGLFGLKPFELMSVEYYAVIFYTSFMVCVRTSYSLEK